MFIFHPLPQLPRPISARVRFLNNRTMLLLPSPTRPSSAPGAGTRPAGGKEKGAGVAPSGRGRRSMRRNKYLSEKLVMCIPSFSLPLWAILLGSITILVTATGRRFPHHSPCDAPSAAVWIDCLALPSAYKRHLRLLKLSRSWWNRSKQTQISPWKNRKVNNAI